MLYFIGTPIGNLEDMSPRAVKTLKEVDIIACEDTRHSLPLLNKFDIKKQLISYHKFNEKKQAEYIISELLKGKSVAVISDAGMPVVSDPGNVLTELLTENDIEYTVIPGPSAFICALVLSGLDASKFSFIGFIPEKKKDRNELLNDLKYRAETLVFYSAPHDVNRDLQDLYTVFGRRKVACVKEITKMHEKAYRFYLGDEYIENPKGEFVIVVEGSSEVEEKFDLTIEEHVNLYISRGMSKKDALKKVSEERGIPKNQLYKLTIND